MRTYLILSFFLVAFFAGDYVGGALSAQKLNRNWDLKEIKKQKKRRYKERRKKSEKMSRYSGDSYFFELTPGFSSPDAGTFQGNIKVNANEYSRDLGRYQGQFEARKKRASAPSEGNFQGNFYFFELTPGFSNENIGNYSGRLTTGPKVTGPSPGTRFRGRFDYFELTPGYSNTNISEFTGRFTASPGPTGPSPGTKHQGDFYFFELNPGYATGNIGKYSGNMAPTGPPGKMFYTDFGGSVNTPWFNRPKYKVGKYQGDMAPYPRPGPNYFANYGGNLSLNVNKKPRWKVGKYQGDMAPFPQPGPNYFSNFSGSLSADRDKKPRWKVGKYQGDMPPYPQPGQNYFSNFSGSLTVDRSKKPKWKVGKYQGDMAPFPQPGPNYFSNFSGSLTVKKSDKPLWKVGSYQGDSQPYPKPGPNYFENFSGNMSVASRPSQPRGTLFSGSYSPTRTISQDKERAEYRGRQNISVTYPPFSAPGTMFEGNLVRKDKSKSQRNSGTNFTGRFSFSTLSPNRSNYRENYTEASRSRTNSSGNRAVGSWIGRNVPVVEPGSNNGGNAITGGVIVSGQKKNSDRKMNRYSGTMQPSVKRNYAPIEGSYTNDAIVINLSFDLFNSSYHPSRQYSKVVNQGEREKTVKKGFFKFFTAIFKNSDQPPAVTIKRKSPGYDKDEASIWYE